MKEYESWFGTFDVNRAQEHCEKNLWTWLIVTDGANGIHVVTKDSYDHIKSKTVEVADVSGAGDSVLAIIAHYFQNIKMINHCIFDDNTIKDNWLCNWGNKFKKDEIEIVHNHFGISNI